MHDGKFSDGFAATQVCCATARLMNGRSKENSIITSYGVDEEAIAVARSK